MTEDDIFATQYAYHNNLRSPVERHSLYERLVRFQMVIYYALTENNQKKQLTFNITIEYCVLKLVLVPNFSLN